MSVATLVATPDPEPKPDIWRDKYNRADLRSMGLHPSAQRGRVARGKYRRHPLGLFVIDGVVDKTNLPAVIS